VEIRNILEIQGGFEESIEFSTISGNSGNSGCFRRICGKSREFQRILWESGELQATLRYSNEFNKLKQN
jgi:hypothetical protein